MSFDPVEALLAYHKALNDHDVESIAEMVADDMRYQSAGLGELQGKAAFVKSLQDYFETFPDHQACDDAVTNISANIASSVWSLRATHKTTRETVERRGVETISYNDDGKITEIVVVDYK
jgi:ketosteroid isomerase-like protein